MSEPKSIIEVHNLTVVYNNRPALWNVNLNLPAGEIIGVMGPNGSGKSTLLKSIMGIVEADTGFCRIFGKPVDEVRKRISYVPQRQNIDWDFPANVTDIVRMGRYTERGLFKRFTKEDHQRVESAIERVGLSAYSKRQISQLSGGQQQRVFLARSIAQEADLYLMDEPFAGVDASTESAIVDLLKEMKSQGKTVLVVHHDLHTADEYFDHLVMLNTKLVKSGPLEEVFNLDTLKDTYGGSMTILSKLTEVMKEKEHPIRHS